MHLHRACDHALPPVAVPLFDVAHIKHPMYTGVSTFETTCFQNYFNRGNKYEDLKFFIFVFSGKLCLKGQTKTPQPCSDWFIINQSRRDRYLCALVLPATIAAHSHVRLRCLPNEHQQKQLAFAAVAMREVATRSDPSLLRGRS